MLVIQEELQGLQELSLEKREELYLVSGPMVLENEAAFTAVRTIGEGQMYLTNQRFLFKSRRKLLLDAPLGEIHSISTDPGNRFHFVFRRLLYQIIIRTESILKWYDTILRLQRETEQENVKP